MLLIVYRTRTVFQAVGMNLPAEVSPLIIVELVNGIVIEGGRFTWEMIAGESVLPPRYLMDFCATRWCPNTAFLYPFCERCTAQRFGLQVWQSTLSSSDNTPQLGLFAVNDLIADKFVAEYAWNEAIPRDDDEERTSTAFRN
jgi:hypothetical protein